MFNTRGHIKMIFIARKNKTLRFGLSIVKAYDTNKMFPTKEKNEKKADLFIRNPSKTQRNGMFP